MTTARTRLLALLAAGMLVLAACGGDDGDIAADDTEQTDASTDDTTDPNSGAGDDDVDQPDADDQAGAEASILTSGDAPGDFTATPPEPSDGEGVFDNPPEGCEYLADFRELGTVTAKAKSDDFASPDGTETVTSTVRVWADADEAADALAVIGSETTPDCLREGLIASVAAEPGAPPLEDVTAGADPGTVGDEGVVIWVSGTIVDGAESAPITIASSFVRVGRAAALVQMMWLGIEPDPDVLGGYSAVVADRLASNFAE